jgi:undecaprenyl-diphosphatase
MNWWEALILGIVQGLAEYLPVSSTAHVVLAQYFLGIDIEGYALEIFLHLGSALALVLYFRMELFRMLKDFFQYLFLKKKEAQVGFYFVLYLLIATFITGVIGVSLKESLATSLKSPLTISFAFLMTAVFLVVVERWVRTGQRKSEDLHWKDAVIVGLVQSIAIIPGVSRSGTTLVASLWLGMEKDLALRFSFLLALPVILGSSAIALLDWNSEMEMIPLSSLSLAFLASFVCSLLGIRWLIRLVQKAELSYFAIYCFLLAIVCFIWSDALI